MNATRGCLITLILLGSLTACGGGGEPTTSPTAELTTTPTVEPTPTPPGLEATVVDVINDVDAHPLPEGEWERAVADMLIHQGGEVWAREASTARLDVDEDLVRVAPNTIFTLGQPEPDTVRLTLEEGQVWLNVEGLEEGETFEVETPNAVASVRGTRFSARVTDGTSLFSTQAGTVIVTADSHTVSVGAGFETVVVIGKPPTQPQPMSAEEQVRWGMASGPNLDVVLPTIDVTRVFTYEGGYAHNLQCSHNGRYAALMYKNFETETHGYLFYNMETATPFTIPLPEHTSWLQFDPTGDRLAYYDYNRNTTCVSAISEDVSSIPCISNLSYSDPVWSPDGESLLVKSYAGSAYNIFRTNPDGSDLTQLTFSSRGDNRNYAWSPDGSQIAYLYVPPDEGAPADLLVMDADGSNPQALLTGTAYRYTSPTWNPAGNTLAVARHGEEEYGGGGGIWIVPLDGADPWTVPGTDGQTCYGSTWSPTDSGWPLFFHSYDTGKYKLWYVPGPEGEATYFGDINWGPVFCPGDTPLAYFGLDSPYGEEVYWTAVYSAQTEPDFYTSSP